MQKQYNENIRFNDYKPGDRAWLKKKYYKSGENRKLSPRKTGPWFIVEKLPNGVNFKVKNESSGIVQIVHHDRLIPMKESVPVEVSDKASHLINNKGNNTPEIVPESVDTFDTDNESDSDTSIELMKAVMTWKIPK